MGVRELAGARASDRLIVVPAPGEIVYVDSAPTAALVVALPPAAKSVPCLALDLHTTRGRGTLAAEHKDRYRHVLGYWKLRGAAVHPRRAKTLAAWSEDAVFVSDDDGGSFTRVLDGPGQVQAVSFDCRGRLFVWRGMGSLGMREGGSERWRYNGVFSRNKERELDERFGPRIAMVATATAVVVVGPTAEGDNSMVAVTTDAGASFRFWDLGDTDQIGRALVEDHGAIRWLTTWSDCRTEGIRRHTLRLTEDGKGSLITREINTRSSPLGLDHRGYAYGNSWECIEGGADSAICELAPNAKNWRRAGTHGGFAIETELRVATGVRHTYAVADEVVYRLREGDLRRIGTTEVDGFHAIDVAGRALAIRDGELLRWSPRGQSRILHGQVLPGH